MEFRERPFGLWKSVCPLPVERESKGSTAEIADLQANQEQGQFDDGDAEGSAGHNHTRSCDDEGPSRCRKQGQHRKAGAKNGPDKNPCQCKRHHAVRSLSAWEDADREVKERLILCCAGKSLAGNVHF
jgi:hypothetical protein